ncbi:DUF1398 family protein [Sphingobacterium oryzagri]|uniref:DUF1398 family protein n=1 Tax=Sphingobacterium oryzagri TaxID=3025669 RepID=A0ABY7WFZ7_9SPHI|nr:DUF1398 family protein [Sphingobacterium sp. KACC 22765]WDF67407.1 DUF1398 family protein [Sphingobacterium sp. KACC 22765]
MFTVEQIKNAHSKVQSGADFPAYIQELKALGVITYDTFVHDGHADYHGVEGYTVSSSPLYDHLPIAAEVNQTQFAADLLAHQQGKTDYLQFCQDVASNGVSKWIVDLTAMTCTYIDLKGQAVLSEAIPV